MNLHWKLGWKTNDSAYFPVGNHWELLRFVRDSSPGMQKEEDLLSVTRSTLNDQYTEKFSTVRPVPRLHAQPFPTNTSGMSSSPDFERKFRAKLGELERYLQPVSTSYNDIQSLHFEIDYVPARAHVNIVAVKIGTNSIIE